MKAQDMNEYVLAIEKIEAHEMLNGIKVSSYPHQKEEHQKKQTNVLLNATRPEQKELDAIDVARALGMI